MKIGIFTPYSLNPIHPRTEMYLSFFRDKGIEAYVEHPEKKPGSVLNIFSRFFINIFDFKSISDLSKHINGYDIILIQDLKLLPLAIPAKRKGKRIIYETLDNSVYIRVHNQRNHFLYPLIKKFTLFYCSLEKLLCRYFTQSIIVNSQALYNYFDKKARLIYYASPFENSGINNNPSITPAFLYLGAISADKGFYEIVEILNKQPIPAFFYGDCSDKDIERHLLDNKLIIWEKRLDSASLMEKIKELTRQYSLIGFSIIKSVHYSYATQEANKEIDYLAMGIPFVGNMRMTTREKIDAGCGVFYDDSAAITELVNNAEVRKILSGRCYNYYQEHYAFRHFNEKVSEIFEC